MVDYSCSQANIWVQLKTWDAQAMEEVIRAVEDYKKAHPFPLELKPAGIAYFNLVWNDEVLWDMVKGFVAALLAVFVILIFNFRSFKWAVVSYVPLLFTILLIYGVVGFSGKRFDMPISLLWTAARPGKGIMRNAVLFAASFAVMMFAPLTPYITVGAFIVSMMMLSALMVIIYLPALIVLLRGWLFKGGLP